MIISFTFIIKQVQLLLSEILLSEYSTLPNLGFSSAL